MPPHDIHSKKTCLSIFIFFHSCITPNMLRDAIIQQKLILYKLFLKFCSSSSTLICKWSENHIKKNLTIVNLCSPHFSKLIKRKFSKTLSLNGNFATASCFHSSAMVVLSYVAVRKNLFEHWIKTYLTCTDGKWSKKLSYTTVLYKLTFCDKILRNLFNSFF